MVKEDLAQLLEPFPPEEWMIAGDLEAPAPHYGEHDFTDEGEELEFRCGYILHGEEDRKFVGEFVGDNQVYFAAEHPSAGYSRDSLPSFLSTGTFQGLHEHHGSATLQPNFLVVPEGKPIFETECTGESTGASDHSGSNGSYSMDQDNALGVLGIGQSSNFAIGGCMEGTADLQGLRSSVALDSHISKSVDHPVGTYASVGKPIGHGGLSFLHQVSLQKPAGNHSSTHHTSTTLGLSVAGPSVNLPSSCHSSGQCNQRNGPSQGLVSRLSLLHSKGHHTAIDEGVVVSACGDPAQQPVLKGVSRQPRTVSCSFARMPASKLQIPECKVLRYPFHAGAQPHSHLSRSVSAAASTVTWHGTGPARKYNSTPALPFHLKSSCMPLKFSVGEVHVSKIGKLTREERQKKIQRYREKRKRRNFDHRVTYRCRKELADTRPRVRGRFARTGDKNAVMPNQVGKRQETHSTEDAEPSSSAQDAMDLSDGSVHPPRHVQ